MAMGKNEVMLGAFVVGAGALLAAMAVMVGGFDFTPGLRVTTKFKSASGLVKGAMVAVSGVEVGKVEQLAVEHDHAVVTLFLRRDAHLRTDVTAVVRAKSLLGEKFLELIPHSATAPELVDGGQIADTLASVEIDELLMALGPLVRKVDPEAMASLLNALGQGFKGKEKQVAAAIDDTTKAVALARALLEQNGGKVNSATAHLAALAANADGLLANQRGNLERTSSNAAALSENLRREAPPLVASARRVAGHAEQLTATLSREAPALTRDAGTVMRRLPGTLDDLHHLQREVSTSLGKANPLLDRVGQLDRNAMREAANDILGQQGIKVYVAPFGPPGPGAPVASPSPSPRPQGPDDRSAVPAGGQGPAPAGLAPRP